MQKNQIKTWFVFFISLMPLFVAGCHSRGDIYTEGFSGKNSRGFNWVNYVEDDWGWTAGVGHREVEDSTIIPGHKDDQFGFQFGVTRAIGKQLGATLEVGMYEDYDLFGSEDGADDGAFFIGGLHYRFGEEVLLGIRHFESQDETVYSVGFNNPFLLLEDVLGLMLFLN